MAHAAGKDATARNCLCAGLNLTLTPGGESYSAPGHKDDNTFHQRTDKQGNTVRVYDVDAEKITGDHASWNEVVTAMTTLAEKNVEMQVPYVLVAVQEFQSALPEYIYDAMWEHQQVSGNPEWIREMVAWFGFPTRTTDNVTQPILHYLNQQFDAMIQQAQQELLASG